MSTPERPFSDAPQQVDLGRLLYASEASGAGPTSAFKPLSIRKIDAGVTNLINARFQHRNKPGLS